VLSTDDDCVDEASIVDEVALSLVEDCADVDEDEDDDDNDDASDEEESVEEESVDDELWDTWALDVTSDEVAAAESELIVIEISEDD